jgi:hypothetical protein
MQIASFSSRWARSDSLDEANAIPRRSFLM